MAPLAATSPEKEGEPPKGPSDAEFNDKFAELVSRRDYAAAVDLCRQRLQAKPNDRYALGLRETVQHFLDLADNLEVTEVEAKRGVKDEEEDEDEEEPELGGRGEDEEDAFEELGELPSMDELQDKAAAASTRAFEAMFQYLREDGGERLWEIGEQAVGIFWDVGQIVPPGDARRDVLREMSKQLLESLARRLRASGRPVETASGGQLERGDWLHEALGQLWWYFELDLEPDAWLLEGCREELRATGGSMEVLVGYSAEGLREAEYSELCDILTQTWTVERSLVCGLFGDTPPITLEYGMAAVLAEIRRRPLHEPPLAGFYDCFYLMTHVVYVLNCFNGHLPNRRSACPWLYAYLERCLGFWLREVRRDGRAKLPASVASQLWSAESVDAVAEAVDCLRGLDDSDSSPAIAEAIREAVAWLLTRQKANGFFFSPGQRINAEDEYNHLHPTWTAAAALQMRRQAPGPSPRCAKWAAYASAAAKEARLADPPPPPSPALDQPQPEASAPDRPADAAAGADQRPRSRPPQSRTTERPQRAQAAPAPGGGGSGGGGGGTSGARTRSGSRGAPKQGASRAGGGGAPR